MKLTDRIVKALDDLRSTLEGGIEEGNRRNDAVRLNVTALQGLLVEVMEDNKRLTQELAEAHANTERHLQDIDRLSTTISGKAADIQGLEEQCAQYERKIAMLQVEWPRAENPGMVQIHRLGIDWMGAQIKAGQGEFYGHGPFQVRTISPIAQPGYLQVQEEVGDNPPGISIVMYPNKKNLKTLGFAFPRVLAKGVADALYELLGLDSRVQPDSALKLILPEDSDA